MNHIVPALTRLLARESAPLTRTGWEGMIADAGLEATITPHYLRHTAGTWLARAGVKSCVAADYLGMTEEFERTYYHEHPDFQAEVGEAFWNAP